MANLSAHGASAEGLFYDPSRRGYAAVYRDNELNHCPGCGRTHWHIGRMTAAGTRGRPAGAGERGQRNGSWVPCGTSGRHRRTRSAAIRPPTASPYRSTAASPYALHVGV